MTLRLFLQIISVEARKRMSYRADFWINTLFGFLAQFGVQYFVATALFAESGASEIRGYARPDLIVYFVSVLLIEKIVRGPEFGGHVAEDIYEGGLTRYLLFPVRYGPFKYAQHIGALVPLFLQAALFGIAAIFVLEPTAALSITPISVLGALVCIGIGSLLYYSMRFPLQAVAFWQDNVWSLSVMLNFVARLLGGAMLPLAFFPLWSQGMLEILPFRFLYDVPVRVLLGQVGLLEWLAFVGGGLLWSGVFLLVSRAVWRRGDLKYTGVGI